MHWFLRVRIQNRIYSKKNKFLGLARKFGERSRKTGQKSAKVDHRFHQNRPNLAIFADARPKSRGESGIKIRIGLNLDVQLYMYVFTV